MLIIGANDHRLARRLFSDEINDRCDVERTKSISVHNWTLKPEI